MFRKFFAVTSLLLPIVAGAATAHAGSTITDKSYWPNVARTSRAGAPAQSNPSAAFALDAYAPAASLPTTSVGGNLGRYQGGPKGR